MLLELSVALSLSLDTCRLSGVNRSSCTRLLTADLSVLPLNEGFLFSHGDKHTPLWSINMMKRNLWPLVRVPLWVLGFCIHSDRKQQEVNFLCQWPLTCEGAMCSIWTWINHYHHSSQESVYWLSFNHRKRRLLVKVLSSDTVLGLQVSSDENRVTTCLLNKWTNFLVEYNPQGDSPMETIYCVVFTVSVSL